MRRPRLTPAIADTRRAVRDHLRALSEGNPRALGERSETKGPAATPPLVLVALSGGPDSLALAAATAFEAPRMGVNAGAVIVDHALQSGSAAVAEQAAAQARALGLEPVLVRRASVAGRRGDDFVADSADSVPEIVTSAASKRWAGPEAAAREARYAALAAAADETGAAAILLAHTLDDQAETVLLGLARGAGAASLRGMAAASGRYLRPFLGLRRATTVAACADQGLEAWTDPMNADPAFARVRVRQTVLPLLEETLGPGIAEALARTAGQLREDAEALDRMVDEVAEDLVSVGIDPRTEEPYPGGGISLPAGALAANPPAIRHRLIRLAVRSEFGVSLSRERTLEVTRLVTDWHGQGPIELPGIAVRREGEFLVFTAKQETAGIDADSPHGTPPIPV